jgi:3-(3-hydroxy-phenyl)propionate hydroxylase
VRLGVDDASDWSMVKTQRVPLRAGDLIPDAQLHGGDGRPIRVHELTDDSFVAFYFTDVRRRPSLPPDGEGLKHRVVSRRDAPLDSGVRERSLFDIGDRFRQRVGVATDTIVLVRPDDHIAAMVAQREGAAAELYRKAVGK